MKQLILHPTDICQWHALINEAQASTQILLGENTESYLVFLLMRFTQGVYLIESIVALDFLQANHCRKHQQRHLYQEVGDKSLLFCGLFPGMAKKRQVSLDYYLQMGQSAYYSASVHDEAQEASLFYQLGQQFHNLSMILSAMRSQDVFDSILPHSDKNLQ